MLSMLCQVITEMPADDTVPVTFRAIGAFG
jgi:hypothetical protein